MAKQNSKNKAKREKNVKEEKAPDQIKKYYEAEAWMFSSCGD